MANILFIPNIIEFSKVWPDTVSNNKVQDYLNYITVVNNISIWLTIFFYTYFRKITLNLNHYKNLL